MNKLLTLLFIFSLSYGMSQSLSLSHNDRMLKNNDTVFLDLSTDDETVFTYIDITNNSEKDYYIKVKKEIIQIADDAILTFCFNGTCFSADTSNNPYILFPNETLKYIKGSNDKGFYTQYGNVFGISVARFTFFDENDRLDTTVFFLVIKTDTISEIKQQPSSSGLSLKAYPNPATERVTIEYSFPNQTFFSTLVLKNIMGLTVLEESLSHKTDKIALDLSNIPRGIYFYSVENSGKAILTKKLIVK